VDVPPSVPNRYELLSCAFGGHRLVGTDAATVTSDDGPLVREMGGLRWYRCLRCDGWFPQRPPVAPTTDRVPGREAIDLPLRGPQLRDRYVLRLIALDRAIHVVTLIAVVVFLLLFLQHRQALDHDYQRLMDALTGSQPNTLTALLGKFRHVFLINPSHLYEVVVVAAAYGTLEAFEMVGLWFAKRWAEYLTFVATAMFLPFEIYELTKSLSVLKITVLVINLAIAVYLLVAKRLFGLRGGHRALLALRAQNSGWAAVDAATVDPPGAPAAGAASTADAEPPAAALSRPPD
jgi:uncharacterized membrane protein (DUF2068 family)